MKRSFLLGIGIFAAVSLIALTSVISFGQTIIDNPKQPSSPTAGRTVKLRELIRIRDDGEKIVFKYPYQLQVGDDGSIHFANLGEFFKYDAHGQFVYKVVKRGQGPGEAVLGTKALLTKDGLLIQAVSPPKMMRFDPKGVYLGEDRTTMTHMYEFVALIDGTLYAFLEESPPFSRITKPDYYDVPLSFCVLSPDLKNVQKPFQFPYRWYLGPGYGWQRALFDFAFRDVEAVFVVHGTDYRIDRFNVRKNAVEKTITRKYDRVKKPAEKPDPRPGLRPPAEEFYYDISKVLIAGNDLWVITSTRNESQSRLIDVFDDRGRYIDNFYLEFPSGFTPIDFFLGRIVLKNGFLYTVDEDAEGFYSIAKYEILDSEKREVKE
jgi:hypothetical protein